MCVFVDDESTWRTSCGGKGKMEELACVNGSLWSNCQGLIIKALMGVGLGWIRSIKLTLLDFKFVFYECGV